MVEPGENGSLPDLKLLSMAELVSDSIPDLILTEQSSKKLTKKPKVKLTPEDIAQQRELRRIRKEQKLKIESAKPCEYIRRKLLQVSNKNDERFRFKIMTYNVLAQALIKRNVFPTNGKALKWAWRSKTLLEEIAYYNCDIMCLQELDGGSFNNFWKKEFNNLGYECKFIQSASKSHGVCILIRRAYFNFKNQFTIKYDEELVENLISSRITTDNVGFLTFIEFSPQLINEYPYLSQKNGIIIGTTHLYWHPYGCFERCRQTYLVLQKFQEFTKILNSTLQNDKGFYKFFSGDMNTEPFDYPYLSITAKPVVYEGQGLKDLKTSIAYLDLKAQAKQIDPEDEIICSQDQCDQIKSLENAHNNLPMRAISLYSIGYNSVHPENSGINNNRNEPGFSNWAHSWRGLLDYIFIITEWINEQDYSEKVDTISQVEVEQKVKLLSLLRMPTNFEMGAEPSGQPRIGQYPSDHLAMIAEIELH